MQFHLSTAEIFVPDGLPIKQALRRTTHMAISAHQDDIEIMAAAPILECFQNGEKWFTGVVLSDGRGSPREGLYKEYTDDAMWQVRMKEQRKAAIIGEYSAMVMLNYPSKAIKDRSTKLPIEDLSEILKFSRPQFVYTHNLADKHDTHVGTTLKVIAAIRSLPEMERPQKLIGCEVWRNLDWMVDTDKDVQDLSLHENLQAALLGVFDSQITGGKRYDLATLGHRRANATYYESHGVDITTGLSYTMDLTPLIQSPEKDIVVFVQEHIQRFANDVTDRLTRLG
jgi:LmbE family N-acetylglucosaminyl deacetylase